MDGCFIRLLLEEAPRSLTTAALRSMFTSPEGGHMGFASKREDDQEAYERGIAAQQPDLPPQPEPPPPPPPEESSK